MERLMHQYSSNQVYRQSLLCLLVILLVSIIFLPASLANSKLKKAEEKHSRDTGQHVKEGNELSSQTGSSYSLRSNRKEKPVEDPFKYINTSDPSFSVSVSVPAALTVAPPLEPLNSTNGSPQDYWVSSSSGGTGTPHPAEEREEFDYIVVGGGSSGSIVAGRLSEAGFSVLLLEAGGPTQWSLSGRELQYYPNLTLFDIPLYWTDITSNPSFAASYEWPLHADPHPQVARGLGGCSVHNAMIYIRGLDRDFNGGGWGSEWSYEKVLPFYKKSVNQRNTELRYSPIHGKDGPIHLSSLHTFDIDPIAPLFLQSCEKAGLSILQDFNGACRREGAGYYQFLIRDGQRETPASAWYGNRRQGSSEKGSDQSAKLTIRTYAQVTRVIFDVTEAEERAAAVEKKKSHLMRDNRKRGKANPNNSSLPTVWDRPPVLPRAIGIDYVDVKPSQDGSTSHQRQRLPRPRRIYARKEVVLSAGAIHSPKILLLSGIGSSIDLKKHDINVVSDLIGVGRNCMDGSKVIMQWDAPSIFFSPCIPWEETGGRGKEKTKEEREKEREYCQHVLQSYYNGKARLNQLDKAYRRLNQEQSIDGSNNFELPAELTSSVSYGIMGTPGFSAGAFLKSHTVLERPNIQLTIFPWDKIQREWKEKHTGIVTMEITTNNPISRGRVTLHSADPFDPPTVEVNYLNDPNDIEVLLWAIKTVRNLVSYPPLNNTLKEELLPGSDLTDEQLKDYILCGAREYRIKDQCERQQRVVGHLGGTVKMGNPYSDAYASVDSHLRVIGVENLRVVDASIMPQLPSGNTHATCMMIGERGADFILQKARGEESTVAEEAERWNRESGDGDKDEIKPSQNIFGLSTWTTVFLAILLILLLVSLGYYYCGSFISRQSRRFLRSFSNVRQEDEQMSRPLLPNGSDAAVNQRTAASAINQH